MTAETPVSVALVNDYDVVLAGLAAMLASFRDRVRVVEIDVNEPVTAQVDIALLDSFGRLHTRDAIDALVSDDRARRVVLYTWDFDPPTITDMLARGVDGYLSKTLSAEDLVDALESVHAGDTVISSPPRSGARARSPHTWPGRRAGLTDREAEMLAFITRGVSNADITAGTRLSPNTVKTYIRSLYRKLGVTNRTQAALWGVRHGFRSDYDNGRDV